METNTITVELTPFEVKMIEMSLHHQWLRMIDDDGKALFCNQESADCVYRLFHEFEKLREDAEIISKREDKNFIVRVDGNDKMMAQGGYQLKLVMNNLKYSYPESEITFEELK